MFIYPMIRLENLNVYLPYDTTGKFTLAALNVYLPYDTTGKVRKCLIRSRAGLF